MKRALGSVPHDSLDNEACKEIQKEISCTKVDIQYCLNFPFTKEYEPLFSEGMNADITRGIRQPLWDVVEQCMRDGTLKDLKFGALDSYLADKSIELQPRLVLPPAPQANSNTTPSEVTDPVSQVAVTDNALISPHGTDTSGMGSNIPQYLQPDEDAKFGDHEPEGPFRILSTKEMSPIPEPESQRRDHSEESEGGVVLNLTSNDHESGEISENSPRMRPDSDEEEGSSKDDHQDYPVDIRGAGDSSPDDAMIGYSNADQAMNLGRTSIQLETKLFQSYQPSTLAELHQEDLREQIKYFYITRDVQSIDFAATPVRCLVCTHVGHMATKCPKLTCTDCGKFNDHFPPFCPAIKKCPRCRKPGHNEAQCKSKLKISNSEIMCELCTRSGHVEEDCELMWRTSGLPGYISSANSRLKYVFCYECGKRSHLGNDCPSRRPRKPMGTSTWTRRQASSPPSGNQLSIRSKGEITIKGRAAQQRQPIPIDPTSEDERSNFVRSKVPAPTKTGRIRIEASLEKKEASTWTPPSSRQVHNPGYSNSLPTDRRPNVPRHAGNGYDNRAYAHHPPLPQEPLPSRGIGYSTQQSDRGESYRPMPSAGQNAWRKRRM